MKLRDTSTPVLVLQMQHHGALGVMRSLGRLGVPTYGVHPTRRPPASFSKFCRNVFELDLDHTSPEESVGRLRAIARGIGSMPLLMPTSDESALFVARNASQLQDHFLFPANPIDVVWSLYNKKAMHRLAKQLSIPTPETVFPESLGDVLEFCERALFPVMLKASDNIRTARHT